MGPVVGRVSCLFRVMIGFDTIGREFGNRSVFKAHETAYIHDQSPAECLGNDDVQGRQGINILVSRHFSENGRKQGIVVPALKTLFLSQLPALKTKNIRTKVPRQLRAPGGYGSIIRDPPKIVAEYTCLAAKRTICRCCYCCYVCMRIDSFRLLAMCLPLA